MDPTWKTLSTRTVVADRWIDLRADRCRTPGGAELDPFYVLGYPDWVNVVALTPAREVVLVRQYRHAVGRVVLELPGGTMDPGETNPLRAARRELLEEAGFDATTWQPLATLLPNPATHTNKVHGFLATGAMRAGPQRLDSGEEGMTVHLMPLDELLDALPSGELGQAMHVASLLLAMRELSTLSTSKTALDHFGPNARPNR